jgi:hypothetical protein
MNIKLFNQLKKQNGSKVVWKEDGEFCFSMGDELMVMDDNDEYDRIQQECEDNDINFYVGYGDDVCNCIGVNNLSDIDKVKGLEEFIIKYVGSNCYTE